MWKNENMPGDQPGDSTSLSVRPNASITILKAKHTEREKRENVEKYQHGQK